jgi:hypothetical protein
MVDFLAATIESVAYFSPSHRIIAPTFGLRQCSTTFYKGVMGACKNAEDTWIGLNVIKKFFDEEIKDWHY